MYSDRVPIGERDIAHIDSEQTAHHVNLNDTTNQTPEPQDAHCRTQSSYKVERPHNKDFSKSLDAGCSQQVRSVVNPLAIAIPVLIVLLVLLCILCVRIRCYFMSFRSRPCRASLAPRRREILREFFNIGTERERAIAARSRRAGDVVATPRVQRPLHHNSPQTVGTTTNSI